MPLPPGYKAQKGERQDFDPIPEGIYQVEIADINEKQKPKFRKPDETETVLDFEFVVLDEGEARGRRLWKQVRPYIVSGDKPSHLYTIFAKVLQRSDLPEDEALGLEVSSLIGKQLMVMVDRKSGKDGKTYNNITAFTIAKSNLNPVETSEPAAKPKATEDRETTLKAIFATSKKLWPTLAAALEPKEHLKKLVTDEFGIKIESWAKASLEQLNAVYMKLKDLESDRITAALGPAAPAEPSEREINIEDIPF